MPRGAREQLIQKAVCQHLALRGAPGLFWRHYLAGGYRSLTKARILGRLGARTAGLPSPAPLAKSACIGVGPAFRKAGKLPTYSREDLDVWSNRRLGQLVRSTSVLIDQGA
jgi:hypothetical protein